MKCTVCKKLKFAPFIIYDKYKSCICSYSCSIKVPTIKSHRIDNIDDFNEPRPVTQSKFKLLTDREEQKLTNRLKDNYRRWLVVEYKKNPIEIQKQINLISEYDDTSDEDESSDECELD